MPVTCLIRAMGLREDGDILDTFGGDPTIRATLEKDSCKSYEEALLEIYRKLRPGEPPTVDSAETLINGLFFDPRRYDLSTVGRYKFNKKLALWVRAADRTLAEPVVHPATGELLFEPGHVLTRSELRDMDAIGVNEVVVDVDGAPLRIFSNHMCDLSRYVDFDPVEELGIKERVRFSVLQELLDQYEGDELKAAIRKRVDDLIPKHIIVDDIFASINYMSALSRLIGQG